MRSLIVLAASSLVLISCNNNKQEPQSFWQQQKDKFKHQQKTIFVSDSVLRSEFASLKMMIHPMFDSLFYGPVYLYSWQERDGTKTEFTVVEDNDERGLTLFYFILDKNDKPLSVTQIAGAGREADMLFETSSKFISHDTIINYGSITKWYDLEARKPEPHPKGDTTFTWFIIGTDGKVTEKIFKEVKALDYDKFIQAD